MLSIFAINQNANAQFGDAGEILRAGAQDAELMLTEYMRPAAEGFSTSLNTGWFNTAGTHSTLGFDLTFRANVSAMPSNLNTFNLNELSLEKSRPINSPVASTIIGPKNTTAVGIYGDNPFTGQEEEITRFNIPEGVNFGYVPSAMAQLSVGLIKNTDLSIRYMPPVTVSQFDLTANLFGIGIKHDIKQWIPGMSLIPIDISVAAGITTFNANAQVDVRPDATTPGALPMSQWDDQEISLRATGTNFNVIAGRTLPFISVYAGLGYETSSTTLKATGNYPVESIGALGQREIERITDPVDIGFDGSNSFRGLAGARLKFFLFTLSADVVVADVTVGSLGFGISFR